MKVWRVHGHRELRLDLTRRKAMALAAQLTRLTGRPHWPRKVVKPTDMKTLILVHTDNSTTVGPTVPADFDTRAWAEKRRRSFHLLRIVRVFERRNYVASTTMEKCSEA